MYAVQLGVAASHIGGGPAPAAKFKGRNQCFLLSGRVSFTKNQIMIGDRHEAKRF